MYHQKDYIILTGPIFLILIEGSASSVHNEVFELITKRHTSIPPTDSYMHFFVIFVGNLLNFSLKEAQLQVLH